MTDWQHGLDRERELGRRARLVVADRLARLRRAVGLTPKGRVRRRTRSFVRQWSSRTVAIVGSLALHAVLVVFLVRSWLSPARVPDAEEDTVTIELRLVDLSRKKPAPAIAEKPDPKPKPKPAENPVPPSPEEVLKRVEEAPEESPPPGPTVALVEPSGVGEADDHAATRLRSMRTLPLPSLDAIGVGSSGGGSPARGLSGMRGQGRQAAIERFGGNASTEDAVQKGLRWLADHQDKDGGWSAAGFARHCGDALPCSGPGAPEYDVGVTALATLAFLGAGHAPNRPSLYSDTVRRAIDWLRKRQGGAGGFGEEESGYYYNHAIACLVFSEAYALSRDEDSRESAAKAIAYLEKGQQAGGGWDYGSPATDRNDLSITGWILMALHTAQIAGLDVQARTLANARQFLDRAFLPSGEGIYADSGMGAGRRGINMVAVGLISHYYLGGDPDASRARFAVDRLLRAAPDPRELHLWNRTYQSYYYWYVATLSLFQTGGKRWEAWNQLLQQTVLPLQEDEGHAQGSWNPEGSWIGASGGRVYATAINVLTLEVYYRYPPLFVHRRN